MNDDLRSRGVSRHDDRRALRREYGALARRLRDARPAGHEVRRHTDPEVGVPATPAGRGRGGWRRPWLADEIDGGFPSMAALVPRIRARFFGEQGDAAEGEVVTRRAEVELTARQADEGVQVPFDLTLRHTCPVCGGRGELWTDPCGACRGSGAGLISHQLQLPVPAGVRHGARLRFSVTPPYAAETHIEVRIAIQ